MQIVLVNNHTPSGRTKWHRRSIPNLSGHMAAHINGSVVDRDNVSTITAYTLSRLVNGPWLNAMA